MNWKEIFNDNPNACSELINWIGSPLGVDSINTLLWFGDDSKFLFPIRDLYDFFDEQGINVIITSEYYYDGINWLWQLLWHTPTYISNDKYTTRDQYGGTSQYGDNGEYSVRTEAEEAAFLKAFEILEKNLNKTTR